MPGNSAVSLWNNTLQVDKTKEVIWDYDDILTDKQKEDFVEAYVDYGLGANYFTQEIIERTEKSPKPKEPTDAELRARRKETKATEKEKKTREYFDKTYDIDKLRNLNQVIKLAQDEGLKVDEFEDPNDGIEVEGKAITPGTSPRERRKILLIASGINAATADEMAGEDSAPFGPSTAPSTYKGVSL